LTLSRLYFPAFLAGRSPENSLHTDTPDELQNLQPRYIKTQVIRPAGRNLEAPFIQLFEQDHITIAVIEQHFHELPCPIEKDIDIAHPRVQAQVIAHMPRQAVKAFADIDCEGVQKVPPVI
jgi:hypothetical protein